MPNSCKNQKGGDKKETYYKCTPTNKTTKNFVMEHSLSTSSNNSNATKKLTDIGRSEYMVAARKGSAEKDEIGSEISAITQKNNYHASITNLNNLTLFSEQAQRVSDNSNNTCRPKISITNDGKNSDAHG